MGDHPELQITPETPGRASIRNPFESPNDYHHLREPLVPSPSVFKSKSVKATPPKFHWSIDEMASLLPVHIDQEDIQRQSFYLSQTRMDSDIEEKRQNAIEQFFTKGTIVPSPWAPSDMRQSKHIYKKSSLSAMIAEEPEKVSVACQTTLSLPLEFDLEKVLGEYYRYEGPCDAVQESLSSSSLRRKLFLDGQGSCSGSDSSNPPSPERCHAEQERASLHQSDEPMAGGAGSQGEVLSSIFSSPLSCGMSVRTPSTGQFSSSPVQNGRFRDCSLGSISSPLFPDRSSPARLISPTISPVIVYAAHTPNGSAERKQSNLTPLGVPLDMAGTSCNESPFVEGCSPIRSCSPLQRHDHKDALHAARPKPRPRIRCWASPPLISAALNPRLQDNHEADDHFPALSFSSLHPMELDALSPLTRDTHPARTERIDLVPMEPLKMEEDQKSAIEGKLGDEEEEEEESGRTVEQLTSSRMGNASATESSQMFLSLLAEGSSIRCDSSMQVDSGYNTTSAGTASLIDGFSSDSHSKESFSSNLMEEAFQVPRHNKLKVFYPHH